MGGCHFLFGTFLYFKHFHRKLKTKCFIKTKDYLLRRAFLSLFYIPTLLSQIALIVLLSPSLSPFAVVYILFICWFIFSLTSYKAMRAAPYFLYWLLYTQPSGLCLLHSKGFIQPGIPHSELSWSNCSRKSTAKMFSPDLLSKSKTCYCKPANKQQKACLSCKSRWAGVYCVAVLPQLPPDHDTCCLNVCHQHPEGQCSQLVSGNNFSESNPHSVLCSSSFEGKGRRGSMSRIFKRNCRSHQ